ITSISEKFTAHPKTLFYFIRKIKLQGFALTSFFHKKELVRAGSYREYSYSSLHNRVSKILHLNGDLC
ncbi:hypothetical protein, partial [Leptospira alexanderi]